MFCKKREAGQTGSDYVGTAVSPMAEACPFNY